MDRRSLVLRIIYAVCLFGATLNHALITARHGIFWDYGGKVPAASAAFWTSLGVIDAAAAALLFLKPNLGVLATVLIIVVDVVHNMWVGARYFPPLLPGLLRDQT